MSAPASLGGRERAALVIVEQRELGAAGNDLEGGDRDGEVRGHGLARPLQAGGAAGVGSVGREGGKFPGEDRGGLAGGRGIVAGHEQDAEAGVGNRREQGVALGRREVEATARTSASSRSNRVEERGVEREKIGRGADGGGSGVTKAVLAEFRAADDRAARRVEPAAQRGGVEARARFRGSATAAGLA